MWTRRELKERAKAALHRNYWKIVLVSVILMVLGCETGGISFHKTVYNNSTAARVEESDEYGNEWIGKKSFINIKTSSDSDTMTVQKYGGGEVETETVETSFMQDVVIGFIIAAVFLIIFLVIFALILIADIFLINPLSVGGKRFMMKSLEDTALVKEVTYGFDHSYKNVVKVMFYRDLYITLWSLLLIIPGIIKMYEYYMVPYILAENPDIEYKAALQMSRDMMEGNKWKTFVLELSFILWHILGTITAGIAEVLYVQPYRNLTFAALYCNIRDTGVIYRADATVNVQYDGNGQYDANGQYGGYDDGQQW